MMKITHIAIALLCILATTSCSDKPLNDEPSPEQIYAPLQLSVKVGDAAQNTPQNASSRAGAVTEAAFGEGVQLGVVLVDKNPAIAVPHYGTRAPYRYVGDYTVPNAPVFNWNASDAENQLIVSLSPAIALAHYPADLPAYATLSSDKRSMSIELLETMPYGPFGNYDGSNITQIELKTDEGIKQILFAPESFDFMTGASAKELTAINDAVQADIVMKHAMAMVVVRLSSEIGAPNYYDLIGGLSLQNVATTGGAMCNGTFALADNSFTPNPAKPVKYDRPMSGFSQGTYFGMFVFPASFGASEAKVVAKVGLATYTFEFPATTWESGTIYLYDINLKYAIGTLGDPVVIKGWIDKNENVELE